MLTNSWGIAACEGGSVETDMGETEVVICVDGVADPITMESNGNEPTASFAYIVTDDSGTVLAYPPSNEIDLDEAGVGICRIYGVSFVADLDMTTGIDISEVSGSLCADVSDNSVRVIREAADGGTVETDGNETEVVICVDGVPDPLTIVHDNVSPNLNYAYVITDDSGMVLAFPSGNTIDLDGAGSGICRIYGVSFSGTLNTTTGIDINSVTATGCSDISDNSVRVIREVADGGTVETDSNETEVLICVDGVPDPLTILHDNMSPNLNYGHIVTDDSGMVLAYPPSNVIDLDGAGAGICRIYGVSFFGTLNTTTGIDIDDVTASGCAEVSDNSVRVTREEADGGMVQTDGNETEVIICVDGVDDPLTIVNDSDAENFNYAYVVTDDSGTVLDFPSSNVIDLNGAGVGICRIYGVSFFGTLNTSTGIDISEVTASGCSDISENSVRVIREQAHGGMVETDDNETEVAVCIDGTDPFTMDHDNDSPNLNYAFVVTDDSDTVLTFPSSNVIDPDDMDIDVEIFRIYGVSFSGTLDTTIDIDISEVTASGCSDISENSVRVLRNPADGGTVETDDNETEVIICVDGVPDPLTILRNTVSPNLQNYAYVITDDSGMVLAFPSGNVIDLDGAGPGICRIYGVSFSGVLNTNTGVDISAVIASGCSDISDNSIRVIREGTDGGTVETDSNDTEVTICVDGSTGSFNHAAQQRLLKRKLRLCRHRRLGHGSGLPFRQRHRSRRGRARHLPNLWGFLLRHA